MARYERRTFRARSAPRWFYPALVALYLWGAFRPRGSLAAHVVSWVVLLAVSSSVLLRTATIVSWDGVTVRTLRATKRYRWTEVYWFELGQRPITARRAASRAMLRLASGALVPVTPRWSNYREGELVDRMNAAAAWFRVPENSVSVEAWLRDNPPTFHPRIAGRPVGPMLTGIGLTSLALAAAFVFPVLHPHRKLDALHQMTSTVPQLLPHAATWLWSCFLVGAAAGVIGFLLAGRAAPRLSQPLPAEPQIASQRSGIAAVTLSGTIVVGSAPVWFWVFVQGLPPQLGAIAVAVLTAVGVFALGTATWLANQGRVRGERFALRGYVQWRHALR